MLFFIDVNIDGKVIKAMVNVVIMVVVIVVIIVVIEAMLLTLVGVVDQM